MKYLVAGVAAVAATLIASAVIVQGVPGRSDEAEVAGIEFEVDAIACLPDDDSVDEESASASPLGHPGEPDPVVAAAAQRRSEPPSQLAMSLDGVASLPLVRAGLRQEVSPQLFSQNEGEWATTEYDHHGELDASQAWCGTTIEQCGCAMTSLANVLTLFQMVATPAGEPLDPATLNRWLGARRGADGNRLD